MFDLTQSHNAQTCIYKYVSLDHIVKTKKKIHARGIGGSKANESKNKRTPSMHKLHKLQ